MSSSSAACCVYGQVLCGLDDSWCSIWREGSSKERALPGPGVPPQLWSGKIEDPAQPEHQQWVHLHTHDLPIFIQTWGAIRVPLAQQAAGQSVEHSDKDFPACVFWYWPPVCCNAMTLAKVLDLLFFTRSHPSSANQAMVEDHTGERPSLHACWKFETLDFKCLSHIYDFSLSVF